MTKSGYRPTIGVECHVQLKTKTKLFSGVNNDAREAPPNTLVSHIDFGLPGALPVLNREAIHLASKAAFALNSSPQPFSKFDRKHYFYPDLPMGYQISQYDEPIIIGGSVDIEVDGQIKTIGITRAHLEADAGKSIHPSGQNYSLVDLNRCGTPLLEIVSQPDLNSAQEAKAFAHELYLAMRYADVSEADLYYGNMRFDVNVSVSNNDQLGIRTETKNLNSFRSVEKAVEYEVKRQIELLEKGQPITQETRGWDDAKQKTFLQRTKENADDYRYMPDPDLPPVVLSQEYIDKVAAEMPVMPNQWRAKLKSLELSSSQIETLLDAEVDLAHINYLSLIDKVKDQPKTAKFLANWFVNLEIPLQRERKGAKLEDKQRLEIYREVDRLYTSKLLSSTNVKILLIDLLSSKDQPDNIEKYAADQGLTQSSDENELGQIVSRVIKDNPKAAQDVASGEAKAIGFLIGQVMKLSQGKANPTTTQDIIKKQLGL
jgi:aspartyl-tRNA(Asn)/glutamyl-tRNA(Gln) amidotransferase subunit B